MYCEAVRRDRTQEVAGSSPASSTKERPAKADLLSVLKTALFGETSLWSSSGQVNDGRSRTYELPSANERSTLLTMRFDRQLDASHGNGFGLFSWLLRQRHFATRRRRLQPRGSTKAPYSWYRATSMTVSHCGSRFRSSFHGRRSPTSSGANRRGGASGSSEHISSSTIALWWLVTS